MTDGPALALIFSQEAQDILKALIPAIGMLVLVGVLSWFWNPGRKL